MNIYFPPNMDQPSRREVKAGLFVRSSLFFTKHPRLRRVALYQPSPWSQTVRLFVADGSVGRSRPSTWARTAVTLGATATPCSSAELAGRGANRIPIRSELESREADAQTPGLLLPSSGFGRVLLSLQNQPTRRAPCCLGTGGWAAAVVRWPDSDGHIAHGWKVKTSRSKNGVI